MEQLTNIVLILVMFLMGLMLAHGIFTRRQKEKLEKEYVNKEFEIEELKKTDHLNSVGFLEKTYEEKIVQLKEQHRRMMLEYEEKIEILESQYKRKISNLKTERDYFSDKTQELNDENTALIEKVNLFPEEVVKPKIHFLTGKENLTFMLDSLKQSGEKFLLASQDIKSTGVKNLLDSLTNNFKSTLSYNILVGLHNLQNFSRDGVGEFISLIELSNKQENFRIRGLSEVPYNLLISDDKWVIYGSYKWLNGHSNVDMAPSLQIFNDEVIESLEEAFDELFQGGYELEVIPGKVAALKRKKDKRFFLKMDSKEDEIFIESFQLKTTLNNLKILRDDQILVKMLVMKKSDNHLYYLGHINRA